MWLVEFDDSANEQDRLDSSRAVLKVLQPLCKFAEVDLFSDIKVLPAEVEQSRLRLMDLSSPRKSLFGKVKSPTYMAVKVDLEIEDHFLNFAPYSIHATLLNDNGEAVATFHDTSHSISFVASNESIQQVQFLLPRSSRLTEVD